MRIVFFGTPELALPSLSALAGAHDVAAVVCRPDRPKGRSKKPVPPPVKKLAEEMGIEVLQPAKLNDGLFEAWLRERGPDLCALVAYGRILKQPILDVPRHGFLNVHPSLLPKYRGPSPMQTAIREGERETGVSVMALDAGMDSGPLLLQEAVPIEPGDTAATLSDRLARLGADLLLKGIELLDSGQAKFRAQDDSQATYTKLFEKADGRIDWSQTATRIHNSVRAAQPWPISHCAFGGGVVRIHQTSIVDETSGAPPGTVVSVEKDTLIVAAGTGCVAIEVIQAPGKRAMPIADYLRGHGVSHGDVFEEL